MGESGDHFRVQVGKLMALSAVFETGMHSSGEYTSSSDLEAMSNGGSKV